MQPQPLLFLGELPELTPPSRLLLLSPQPDLGHLATLSAKEAGKASCLAVHISRERGEMHTCRQLKVSGRTQRVPPPPHK